MKKNRILLILYVNIVVVLVPVSVWAQPRFNFEPPHVTDPFDDEECLQCHYMLPQDFGIEPVPRGAEQEALCKTCHNPTGVAAAMSQIGNHGVNDNSTIIDCSTCHDPHARSESFDSHTGITDYNLKLIRSAVSTDFVPDVLNPVVFQQTPEHFAFADGNPPYNGVCQACHTQTNYHTNDGTGDYSHFIGTNCTGCHAHQSGFLPSGGGGSCTGCHSAVQDNGDGVPVGGRRGVAGEFPEGNAGLHAHYGADVDSACSVCHRVGPHMDGIVELIDPDDGSIYSFVNADELNSDPDLSDFCANCHDDDGAQRLASPFDPFGNGNSPPDVATRFLGTLQWDEWYGDFCFGNEGTLRKVNSHHDISDGDQAWSGAKIECLNCHGAHNASADTPVANPADTTQAWTGVINDFCLSCHYGGIGPEDPGFPSGGIGPDVSGPSIAMRGIDPDNCTAYNHIDEVWHVDYTWTFSPHGLDSKRGWEGYSGAPGYELDCTVCHDSHGSYTPTNTLGNPYMIRDFVDGTPFVDDGVRPGALWTGPPWDTYGTAGSVVVAINGTEVDWGSSASLCIKCHANWLGAYDWHSYCNGCQTCHGHGQSWDGYDWGPGNDDDTNCAEVTIGGRVISFRQQGLESLDEAPDSHHGVDGSECSACHDPHR